MTDNETLRALLREAGVDIREWMDSYPMAAGLSEDLLARIDAALASPATRKEKRAETANDRAAWWNIVAALRANHGGRAPEEPSFDDYLSDPKKWIRLAHLPPATPREEPDG